MNRTLRYQCLTPYKKFGRKCMGKVQERYGKCTENCMENAWKTVRNFTWNSHFSVHFCMEKDRKMYGRRSFRAFSVFSIQKIVGRRTEKDRKMQGNCAFRTFSYPFQRDFPVLFRTKNTRNFTWNSHFSVQIPYIFRAKFFIGLMLKKNT